MPSRITEKWWRRACDKSPEAIAFVDPEDRFIYVNRAWCELTGYADSELIIQKRWQDITDLDDVGADQSSTEDVRDGESEEYYLEKHYIRKDGSRLPVGIYVHRHPPFGPQEGYLVFARAVGSQELADLRASYRELHSSVAVLEEMSRGFARIDERVTSNALQIERLTSLVESVIGGRQSTGVTIGDVTGRDRAGRDNNSTQTLIILGIVLVGFAVLVLGGALLIRPDSIQIGSQPAPVEVIVE